MVGAGPRQQSEPTDSAEQQQQQQQQADGLQIFQAPPPQIEPLPDKTLTSEAHTAGNLGVSTEQTSHNDQSPYIQPPPPAYSQMENQKPHEEQQYRLVTPLARLGEEPADVDCPYCRQITRTGVTKNDSSMTIISGVLLGILCICLACLPCCMGACADVDHYCSKCGKQLTHRPHDGQTQVVANLPQDMVPSKYPNTQAQQPEQPPQLQQPSQAQQPQ